MAKKSKKPPAKKKPAPKKPRKDKVIPMVAGMKAKQDKFGNVYVVPQGTGTGGKGSRGGEGAYKERRPANARDSLRSGGINADIDTILRDREQGRALRRRLGGGSLAGAFGSQDQYGGTTGSRSRVAQENPDVLAELIKKELDKQKSAQDQQPAVRIDGEADAPLIREVIVPPAPQRASPKIVGGIISPRTARDNLRKQDIPELDISTTIQDGKIKVSVNPQIRMGMPLGIVQPPQRIKDEGEKFRFQERREDQIREAISLPQSLPPPSASTEFDQFRYKVGKVIRGQEAKKKAFRKFQEARLEPESRQPPEPELIIKEQLPPKVIGHKADYGDFLTWKTKKEMEKANALTRQLQEYQEPAFGGGEQIVIEDTGFSTEEEDEGFQSAEGEEEDRFTTPADVSQETLDRARKRFPLPQRVKWQDKFRPRELLRDIPLDVRTPQPSYIPEPLSVSNPRQPQVSERPRLSLGRETEVPPTPQPLSSAGRPRLSLGRKTEVPIVPPPLSSATQDLPDPVPEPVAPPEPARTPEEKKEKTPVRIYGRVGQTYGESMLATAQKNANDRAIAQAERNKRTQQKLSKLSVSDEFGFSTPPMIYNPTKKVKTGLDRGGVPLLRPSQIRQEGEVIDPVYEGEILKGKKSDDKPREVAEPPGDFGVGRYGQPRMKPRKKPVDLSQPPSIRSDPWGVGKSNVEDLISRGIDRAVQGKDKRGPREMRRRDYERLHPSRFGDPDSDKSDPKYTARSLAKDIISEGIDMATKKGRISENPRKLHADFMAGIDAKLDKLQPKGTNLNPTKAKKEKTPLVATPIDPKPKKPRKLGAKKQALKDIQDAQLEAQIKAPRVAKGPPSVAEGKSTEGFKVARTDLTPKPKRAETTGTFRPTNQFYTTEIRNEAIKNEERVEELRKIMRAKNLPTKFISGKQLDPYMKTLAEKVKDMEDRNTIIRQQNELMKRQKAIWEYKQTEKRGEAKGTAQAKKDATKGKSLAKKAQTKAQKDAERKVKAELKIKSGTARGQKTAKKKQEKLDKSLDEDDTDIFKQFDKFASKDKKSKKKK